MNYPAGNGHTTPAAWSASAETPSAARISLPPPPSVQPPPQAGWGMSQGGRQGFRGNMERDSVESSDFGVSAVRLVGATPMVTESTTDGLATRRRPSFSSASQQSSVRGAATGGGLPVVNLDQAGMYRMQAASSTDAAAAGGLDTLELSKTLARAVIKLGHRVTSLENKMAEAIQAILALQKLGEQLKERVR